MIDSQQKKCPRCGKTFACCRDSDCWCEQARLLPREQKLIWIRYDDCLCPECLKEFEEK